ncbi:MAG: exodeoxyribonuclease VII large subunit [Anaerolineae bacterium]|nr:exodeoxyribonuclease VII large subunit [Anaerolineae bacterium]
MERQTGQARQTIPQINSLVRALVEQETIGYPFWINGIVTRYYLSNMGHAYFDLSDDDYTISCMLHERRRGALNFDLNKGMELEVFGSVRVYEKQAKVQIDVEQVRLINHDAYQMDVTVQEKLTQMGCWPPQKQALPPVIERIGIVTSKHSEGLHDFEDTYRRESGAGAAATQVIDVRIQGQQAPHQIAQAIERLNRERSVDVITLIRGGGRADELAVYNDLAIAEAICRSEIPIVTGIGHQRDDTLADQMADVATITPTAAALELAKHAQVMSAQTASSNHSIILFAIFTILGIIAVVVFLLQSAPK